MRWDLGLYYLLFEMQSVYTLIFYTLMLFPSIKILLLSFLLVVSR